MTPITTRDELGPLSEQDLRYIERHYLPLPRLCASTQHDEAWTSDQIRSKGLPLPSYLLADGTPMFPRDYFGLLESAGSVERLRPHFITRYETAARLAGRAEPGKADAEFEAYLDGLYGVCLWQATPENIFLKEHLVLILDRLYSEPESSDARWREEVRTAVDALDALSRPFTACDHLRFGRPPSRERLITLPRQRYEWLRG